MGEKNNFHELMFELKGSCWYEPQLKRHQLELSVMKNKYSWAVRRAATVQHLSALLLYVEFFQGIIRAIKMYTMVELGREKKFPFKKLFKHIFESFKKIRFDTLVMKLATI